MMAWNRAQTFFGGALNQVGDEGITAVSTTIKENATYHVAFVMNGDTEGGTEGTLTGYLNGNSLVKLVEFHSCGHMLMIQLLAILD